MWLTLKDSYSTPFPITFLAYFCHNGWKTYLKSQFPEQLGWPHDTGRGSKEGYVSLKTRQGSCTTKSPSPLVFPFFPAWNTDKTPRGSTANMWSWDKLANESHCAEDGDSARQQVSGSCCTSSELATSGFHMRWEKYALDCTSISDLCSQARS